MLGQNGLDDQIPFDFCPLLLLLLLCMVLPALCNTKCNAWHPLERQRDPEHDYSQQILLRRVSPQPNPCQGRCCFNEARMISFMRFLLLLLLLLASLPVHQNTFCGNDFRWRPYRVEYTGSLPTSEVKQHRARLVLGWGTAWEHLRVLPAFSCS